MNEIIFDLNNFKYNENYSLSASAGTGKTYSITEIVYKLINDYKLDISKLVIVTYTEKAAGELKNRIREKCTSIDVDKATIGTIHSFCKTILDEFSISSGQPTELELINEAECKEIISRYIRKVIIEKEKNIITNKEIDINLSKLETYFVETINKYYLNFKYQEDKNVVFIPSSEYMELIIDLSVKVNSLKGITDNEILIEQIKDFKIEENYKEEFEIFLNHLQNGFYKSDKISLRKSSNIMNNFVIKLLEQSDEKYAATFKKNINSKNKYYLYILSKYIKDVYKLWQEEKEKNKQETFNDMIRYIRENIVNDDALKEKLKEKYTYAIIDEFQDTNTLQWDIFREIFTKDNDHHIIVVGDDKQSIYSFQGADLNVYENAVKYIKENNGNIESLKTNYRSSKKLVDMYNDFFLESNLFKEKGYENVNAINNIEALFDGKVIEKPLITILSKKVENLECTLSSNEYSKLVANMIVECCSYGKDEKTRLQLKEVDKNNKEHYRNVSFKDFALLARTKSEMKPFMKLFKKIGIPFSRYKDDSLFSENECFQWMVLLDAIAKEDYTGNNRKAFKRILKTNFFGRTLLEISSIEFDKDDSLEMKLLLKWHEIAKSRKWEELIDSIIFDSNLENKMASLTEAYSLNKFRQIGEYILEKLKETNSITDVINSLKMKSENSVSDDPETDESIVGKGNDFDCVQFMTIHASKGLEFPIVISLTGFVGKSNTGKIKVFHDEKYPYISIDNSTFSTDEEDEIKRLYYVDFTRAKYLLLIPGYKSSRSMKFYNEMIDNYCKNSKHKFVYGIDENYNLNCQIQEKIRKIVSANSIKINEEIEKKAKEDQLKIILKLIESKKSHMIFKHSYSSLSGCINNEEVEIEGNSNLNKEGLRIEKSLKIWDINAIQVMTDCNEDIDSLIFPIDYPKGTRIGTCLHAIFEKFNFEDIDKDNNLDDLIFSCFKEQGYKLKDSWLSITKEMIKNVLNASFPYIEGNKKITGSFKLKDIVKENRKQEVEFNFNSLNSNLKNYCNGFIDLMFKINDRYCILDWKSNVLNDTSLISYTNNEHLKNEVDKAYSIQRVLYSYCLIKWLKNFYKDETEEEIFNNHFGGIYYVFIRGCNENTGNGIYAQTWESWDVLNKTYLNICYKLMGGK